MFPIVSTCVWPPRLTRATSPGIFPESTCRASTSRSLRGPAAEKPPLPVPIVNPLFAQRSIHPVFDLVVPSGAHSGQSLSDTGGSVMSSRWPGSRPRAQSRNHSRRLRSEGRSDAGCRRLGAAACMRREVSGWAALPRGRVVQTVDEVMLGPGRAVRCVVLRLSGRDRVRHRRGAAELRPSGGSAHHRGHHPTAGERPGASGWRPVRSSLKPRVEIGGQSTGSGSNG